MKGLIVSNINLNYTNVLIIIELKGIPTWVRYVEGLPFTYMYVYMLVVGGTVSNTKYKYQITRSIVSRAECVMQQNLGPVDTREP